MGFSKFQIITICMLALLPMGCGGSNGTAADPLATNQPGANTAPSADGSVIMFTSAAGTAPGSQTDLLTPAEKEVDGAAWGAWADFLQLIPFKLVDAQGNPRPGVQVTLSLYSITTRNPGDVTIAFLVPPISEPNQQTITTDSAGQGIFNVTVGLAVPGPGSTDTVAVVFKAVSGDSFPISAYVGNTYSISAKALPAPAP
jgi:hypothetical protein